MEDIRSVLSQFKKKRNENDLDKSGVGSHSYPDSSEIPDLFFDEILHLYKLSRMEILVLMFLYRQVWSWPNLYKKHGIGPLNSFSDLASRLNMTHEELVNHLHTLEKFHLIETVRSGQYFVRKYFTEEFDFKFGQHYDDFF
jgi:DNA-binding MarR family transcriptional regulator